MKNGNVGSYLEGSCVPVLMSVTNKEADTATLNVTPVYDYFNDAVGIEGLEELSSMLVKRYSMAGGLSSVLYEIYRWKVY